MTVGSLLLCVFGIAAAFGLYELCKGLRALMEGVAHRISHGSPKTPAKPLPSITSQAKSR
jgi:hypothetical protein